MESLHLHLQGHPVAQFRPNTDKIRLRLIEKGVQPAPKIVHTLRKKENNKSASSSKGKITLSVTKTKPETGEVIGVFESVQPSDTDLGAKAPKDVKIQGIWYAQLES